MLLLNLIPNKMAKLIMKLFVYGSVPVSDNTSRQSNGWVKYFGLLGELLIVTCSSD